MQACPSCGVIFNLHFNDEDPPYVRNPCACERGQTCQYRKRCRKLVAQVYVQQNGVTVFSYRCQEHGVEGIEFQAPTKVSTIRSLETRRISPGALTNIPKPGESSLSDEAVYSQLYNQLQDEPADRKTVLRCTNCFHEHAPTKRKWVRAKEKDRRSLVSTCPTCDTSGYVAVL